MTAASSLPSVWRLAWMLFMQPILLHRELIARGIQPDEPAWRLWRTGGIHRQYVIRLMTAGLLLLLLIYLILIITRLAVGVPINWRGVAGGVAGGIAFGVALGVVYGVVYGVVFGVTIGVAVGMVIGTTSGVALGVASGVALGVASGVALGVNDSVNNGEAPGALGVAVGVAVGVILSVTVGATVGVAFGISFITCIFRFPFYLIEYLISLTALLTQSASTKYTLKYQPILFHDLSHIPLYFLEKHILMNAAGHPSDVAQVLTACERSPGQQGMYRRVAARLAAQTLEAAARSSQFLPVMTLQGQWLPATDSASQGILFFRDIAKYIEAARLASTTHQRQKYLNDAQRELSRLPLVLAEESKERRAAFAPLQPIWQEKLAELRAQADADAANSVPNPFLTQSLSSASGVEVFVGRDDLIRTLDAILADPQQRNSLALLGPRRCGKSSLLRMLPLKLPDAVPVFFDLQDNPATTPAQFFSAIASRAAEQARRERDLVLPKLAPNPDITAFAQWLEQVDAALGSRRLLLCIDEFERLPDLFPGDHRALLQLMGLFRATVQNRRNIRLLVAGVAPFDELDAIWSDHLINLRELRVEHLDPDSAMRLLTRPIPGFNAIPEAVAREVITRTGCQPLLLQLYGSMLVDRLNAEQRTEATPDDLAAVDRAVREEGNAVNHFRNIYDSAPGDARAVLLALSDPDAPTPKMSSATRRYLLRRCFITPEGVPRIPVFFDWVQAEHG